MKSSFLNLIALATIIAHSHARDCTFTNSTTIFREPAQITNILNCDTFPTSVQISSIFPGTFSLSNIINITGSISIYHEFGPPVLTSIVLDDLQYLGSLDLNQTTWDLDFVSMGALKAVGNVTVSSNKESTLRFPGLKSAGVLELNGNVSTIDFGFLVNVSQIRIRQPVLVGQYAIIQMPALNATFPALKSCDYLTTWGNISELSMPNLIGGKDIHSPISIDVQTNYESPVPINFDSLTNAADIDVKGFIEPLHMPVLANASSISAAVNGDVNFPRLVNATDILVQGQVCSLSLPALQYLNESLRVQTYRPFNCSPLRTVYDHTSTIFAAQYGYNSPAYENRVFRCQSYYVGETKEGLSQDVRNGPGFGLGLGGGLAAVLGFA
ncbi:uncharacterized protein EAF01_010581 [Botrytis porri]|uniref:Uncharacterized protein n=1 Tax=Botrytis porri TaxID=87229 RepID=A0A4Z1KD57_9HELO|nr:uncharacterized protein EAF01_010581 [Botrytis porri]KAF7890772.1 hypothetical protein EAF01_010581 [Botrytis porri]TGO82132.1 hypothetical protein BPOR_0912g00010 [Botrytis porri]